MARPIKDGVSYFPKDTDFYEDDKVRLLRAEFGAKGMYVLDYLLCDLYGKNGYFLKWDGSKCLLVSDGAGCGCSPQFIAEFIAGCIRCSFFDERVFNMFGVLTSAGIQRRFMRMLNSREIAPFFKEYLLLDVDDKKDIPESSLNKLAFKNITFTDNPVKSTDNPVKSTDNAQSKREEKKANEKKVSKAPLPPLNDFSPQMQEMLSAWLKYKSERKEAYVPTGLQKFFTITKNKIAEYGELEVMRIMELSMSNGWQGVIWEKLEKGRNYGTGNAKKPIDKNASKSIYGNVL